MSMSDSVADMITRIRNGQNSQLMTVLVPHSRIKCSVLEVLKEEGYIKNYNVIQNEPKSVIEVELKYSIKGEPVIREISKVSKPGKRIYSSMNNLKGYYNNMGIQILTTSKGVMSDRKAHQYGIGGEIMCKVF